MHYWRKPISIIVALTFIWSNISFAAPSTTAQDTVVSQPAQNDTQLTTDKIVIPREFGLVKSKYEGKDRRIVVHIQDAHCNYEAQTNIAKIVENLVKNYNLSIVSVEGADGYIDTTWFKAFPDEEVRKEVATYFMKKGEITGPEFLSITTDYPIKLYGAETRAYYIENLNAFTSSYPLKEETEKYFSQIKTVLNKLKTYIYNDELKAMDAKMQDYEMKKVPFNEYARFLQDETARHKINLRPYDNFFKLVSVLTYEKKIDFNVVDKERATLIDEVSKKITKDNLTELVSQSLSFKVGKISSAEFYDYLKNLSLKNGVELVKKYPNLANYIIYNGVYSKIENERLFTDIKNIEIAVKEKLFQSEDQRALEKLSRHIDILIGLINIKLLNADFEYYKSRKEEFAHTVFTDFIVKKIANYGLSYDLGEPSQAVQESIGKLEDFYAIAIKRDTALVENTMKVMDKENAKIVVLVTGGFHSEGITKLLEKQGLSYMVVCPSITKDVPTPYIQILTNQRTPLEEILTGGAETKQGARGMLAPYSIAWALGLSRQEAADMDAKVRPVAGMTVLDRLDRFLRGFEDESYQWWLKKALEYSQDHKFNITLDLMKQAYAIGVNRECDDLIAVWTKIIVEEHGRDAIAAQADLKAAKARIERSRQERLMIVAEKGSEFDTVFMQMAQVATPAPRDGVDKRAPAISLSRKPAKHGQRLSDNQAKVDENTVNGVTRSKIVKDNGRGETVYTLNVSSVRKPVTDVGINTRDPKELTDDQIVRLTALKHILESGDLTLVVITGLREALIKAGVAPDLISHSDATRRAIYIDEDDLCYLLSLPNGNMLMLEAVNHGLEHINNPDELSEEAIENKATSENVRLALVRRDIDMMAQQVVAGASKKDLEAIMTTLRDINLWLHYLKPSEAGRAAYNKVIVIKSDLARECSGLLMKDFDRNHDLLNRLTSESMADIRQHVHRMVKGNKITVAQGETLYSTTVDFLQQWLEPKNGIPEYIRQGVYRAMLEGRYGDILYAYGFGWRQFGTAGIRNQAVQSEFKEIVQAKELDEFAKNPHAPILTGPNLINSVTLLQQASALVKLTKDLKAKLDAKLEEGKSLETAAREIGIEPEFAQNVMDNIITIAYDSRLNGEYFGHLLAAAFLKKGVKVNLFDAPGGVPAGAAAAKGASFFGELAEGTPFAAVKGSTFGILISASHSEAEYNGFKAFLGYQKSQVDAATKDMIMDARAELGYYALNMDLDTGSLEDLNTIFKQNKSNLTWLGSEEPLPASKRDYCGANFIPFYPVYFGYLSKRSPVPYGQLSHDQVEAMTKTKGALNILYTAFYGVGAVPAANLPRFFGKMGYGKVDLVKQQTEVMDGRFPGHIMPDPGVVEGWMSNLYQYVMQIAGEDLANIEKAVESINKQAIATATDPDIDRAGMMLSLPIGVKGNLRDDFINWMEKTLSVSPNIPTAQKERVMGVLRSSLQDKLLLTANDAWAFMAYYKLAIREKYGLLDKNKTYILMKSHVTTEALEKVAESYRLKGYNVHVVNTFVGFTELAKKGRDLFDIAKTSWQIKNLINAGKSIEEALKILRRQNEILKQNVPYETAGLPRVEKVIEALASGKIEEAKDLLDTLARMEIVLACEESNGYGELGEYIPENDKVVNAHISEKDGGLALYEFFEIVSYGSAVLHQSAYEMYAEMLRNIGSCSTNSRFLKYYGVTGIQEKTDSIENLEKIFAPLLQKSKDQGKAVTLFNGKYAVDKVAVFRDRKYDVVYNGFPEEGMRLLLTTRSGSRIIVNIRPSGTGDSNRVYSWVIAPVPTKGQTIEAYRAEIDKEVEEARKDFFGVFGTETGYANLPKTEFYGLLTALKEAGKAASLDILSKVADVEMNFTPAESELYNVETNYTFATRKQDFAHMADAKRQAALAKVSKAEAENYEAWEKYLATEEARSYPKRFQVFVNGQVFIEAPNAFVKPWLAGLSGYVALKLLSQGLQKAEISSEDQEVTDWIKEKITFIQKNPEAYRKFIEKGGAQEPAGSLTPGSPATQGMSSLGNLASMYETAPRRFWKGQVAALRSILRYGVPGDFEAFVIQMRELAGMISVPGLLEETANRLSKEIARAGKDTLIKYLVVVAQAGSMENPEHILHAHYVAAAKARARQEDWRMVSAAHKRDAEESIRRGEDIIKEALDRHLVGRAYGMSGRPTWKEVPKATKLEALKAFAKEVITACAKSVVEPTVTPVAEFRPETVAPVPFTGPAQEPPGTVIPTEVRQILNEAFEKHPVTNEAVRNNIIREAVLLYNTVAAYTASGVSPKKLVVLYDTGLAPGSQTGTLAKEIEDKVRKYFHDSFIEIRGNGAGLLDNFLGDRDAQKAIDEGAVVVTIAGEETMKAIDTERSQEKGKLGKVLQVRSKDKSGKYLYLPVIGLYDLAIKIANKDRVGIERFFENFADTMGENDTPISVTDDDINHLIQDGGLFVLRILPRTKAVDLDEARAAYQAAQLALKSL